MLSTWWPARQGLGALAVISAALTGAFGIGLGGTEWHAYGAIAYVLIAMFALFSPAAIAVQVVFGLLLVGSLLLDSNGPPSLLLVPAMATVILTAELLAVVARMDTPVDSDPRSDLPRAGMAALIGAGVFAMVGLVTDTPGPTGLLAIILASGACVLVAALLVRDGG